jgi:hypothetical protein
LVIIIGLHGDRGNGNCSATDLSAHKCTAKDGVEKQHEEGLARTTGRQVADTHKIDEARCLEATTEPTTETNIPTSH